MFELRQHESRQFYTKLENPLYFVAQVSYFFITSIDSLWRMYKSPRAWHCAVSCHFDGGDER